MNCDLNLVRTIVNSMVNNMNSMVHTCNYVSQSRSDEILESTHKSV